MSQSGIFFGGKLDFDKAFEMDFGKIYEFLWDVQKRPTYYGVPNQYNGDATLAVRTLCDKLLDHAKPSLMPAEAITLSYQYNQTHKFKVLTVMDILGWVFSIACVPPHGPIAKPYDFYFRLAALYVKFGNELLDENDCPVAIAVYFFQDKKGVNRVLVGSTVCIASKGRQPSKAVVSTERRTYLGQEHIPTTGHAEGKLVGDCAETYPFLFLKFGINDSALNPSTVYGFAVGRTNELDETHYDAKAITDRLVKPCTNCSNIIKGKPLEMVLDHFYPERFRHVNFAQVTPQETLEWTDDVFDPEALNTRTSKITGQKMEVRLGQVDGTMYLFQSGHDFYMVDIISDVVSIIKTTDSYEGLVVKINQDFDSLELEARDFF